MSYDYQTADPFLYALLKEFAQKIVIIQQKQKAYCGNI